VNPNLFKAAEAPIVEFKTSLPNRDREREFDMSQAVPSYGTFKPILDGLKRDLDRFATGFYTPVQGLPELQLAIRNAHPLSSQLDASNILVTAGANHAMYTALTALFAPGDKVTLLEPYYFNYDMALDILGLTADYCPLSAETGFQLCPEKVLSHLQTSGSKGLIVITPNNPTGATYRGGEIDRLLEGCARLGVEVLLDETYGAFDPDHLKHSGIGAFLNRNLSLIGSFSKSFSLTGYRVGYWATQTTRMGQAIKLQDTMTICAPHLSQLAALHGLNECQALLGEKTIELTKKAVLIKKYFSEERRYKLRSVGPFFAYVEHPYADLTAREAATKLYVDSGVLALPGSVFGKSQERYLRLAYENLTPEQLTKALKFL